MSGTDNTTTSLDNMGLGAVPTLPPAALAATVPASPAPVSIPPNPEAAAAAERTALQALNKNQLLVRAKELNFEVPVGATKDALVDLILNGPSPLPPESGTSGALTRAEAWARVDDARTAGVKPSLAGFDLSGVDFTTPQYKRRTEAGKVVTDTLLMGMDLHGVDFSGAVLDDTSFINCNLQGCTFTGATGTPKATGADLRWAVDSIIPVDEQSLGL